MLLEGSREKSGASEKNIYECLRHGRAGKFGRLRLRVTSLHCNSRDPEIDRCAVALKRLQVKTFIHFEPLRDVRVAGLGAGSRKIDELYLNGLAEICSVRYSSVSVQIMSS